MSDDRFFERLRDDAQQLRYEPADDVMWTRLAARVRDRIQSQPTVAQLLASWFRPIAASLLALSLAAALGIEWIEQTREPSTIEAMVSASAPTTDFGALNGE